MVGMGRRNVWYFKCQGKHIHLLCINMNNFAKILVGPKPYQPWLALTALVLPQLQETCFHCQKAGIAAPTS